MNESKGGAAGTKAEVSPATSPTPELAEVVDKWMAKSADKAEQPRWKFVVALLEEIRAAMGTAGKQNPQNE